VGAGIDGEQAELDRRGAAVEREDVHARTSIQAPIAMKPTPATVVTTRGLSQAPSSEPTRTATRVEVTSAPAAAATPPMRLSVVSVANSIVASCALSPISARSTLRNTMK